jgi:uncharacterized protein
MLIGFLLVVGLWAVLQNTLAGGGSFVTLPALILWGMTPLSASAVAPDPVRRVAVPGTASRAVLKGC